MEKQYVYFYLMTTAGAKIGRTAPAHAEYWRQQQLAGYQGGPFADRIGGMIRFEAGDQLRAEALAAGDPFRAAGVIGEYWVKEWNIK